MYEDHNRSSGEACYTEEADNQEKSVKVNILWDNKIKNLLVIIQQEGFRIILGCYILSGTSMPSNDMPDFTTLATFSDNTRRNCLISGFSSRRIEKSW